MLFEPGRDSSTPQVRLQEAAPDKTPDLAGEKFAFFCRE
jgi:hypothetical protein